jgi:hypothetical protein
MCCYIEQATISDGNLLLILLIRKLIAPADQRRPKPLQMQILSLDLQVHHISGALESAECPMLQTNVERADLFRIMEAL